MMIPDECRLMGSITCWTCQPSYKKKLHTIVNKGSNQPSHNKSHTIQAKKSKGEFDDIKRSQLVGFAISMQAIIFFHIYMAGPHYTN